jgi:antagonist of KipI
MARLANRLAGNHDAAAVLEVTLIGPALRVPAPTRVALAGRFEATIDGVPFPPFASRVVPAGSTIRIADGTDARGYLAFGGGILVEPVLGSASTDLRTGFGGPDGRALRTGDRLALGTAAPSPALRWAGTDAPGPIRILEGPHADRIDLAALTGTPWIVSPRSDRAGVRLEGTPIPAPGSEIASVGLPVGAVQVPPDGLPIVGLADRPVTGGYAVPAVVIGADVGRVARRRPGDELRFVSVSLVEARSARRRAEDELAALEALEGPGGGSDELGWVGSHD